MVKKYKCNKCGRMVADVIKDEKGVYFCWNCGSDPALSDVVIPEWIIFEASSIQRLGDNRYIIEIPKSLNFMVNDLGEHIRRARWKVQIKSQVR